MPDDNSPLPQAPHYVSLASHSSLSAVVATQRLSIIMQKLSRAGEWNVSASPDGVLTDLTSGRRFGSLFWEATRQVPYDLQPEQCFCVASAELESFLQDKLAILGLNWREASDFIVYWLPSLKKNKFSLIRFLGITRKHADLTHCGRRRVHSGGAAQRYSKARHADSRLHDLPWQPCPHRYAAFCSSTSGADWFCLCTPLVRSRGCSFPSYGVVFTLRFRWNGAVWTSTRQASRCAWYRLKAPYAYRQQALLLLRQCLCSVAAACMAHRRMESQLVSKSVVPNDRASAASHRGFASHSILFIARRAHPSSYICSLPERSIALLFCPRSCCKMINSPHKYTTASSPLSKVPSVSKSFQQLQSSTARGIGAGHLPQKLQRGARVWDANELDPPSSGPPSPRSSLVRHQLRYQLKHEGDELYELILKHRVLLAPANKPANDFSGSAICPSRLLAGACAFPRLQHGPHLCVVVAGAGSVHFLDCNNGDVYCEFQDPSETCFSAVAITNVANTDGKEVLVCAAAGSLGLLRLIDLTRSVWYADKDILPTPVRALAFHPKQPRWLLSGGEDTKISLWELDAPPASDTTPVPSGMRLLAVFQDSLPIWSLSWSPDGELFVAGSQGSLRCWHIRNLGTTSDKVELRTKNFMYWLSHDVPPPIQSVFFLGPDLLLARGSTNRNAKVLTVPRELSEPELCLTLDVRSSEFRRAETLQGAGGLSYPLGMDVAVDTRKQEVLCAIGQNSGGIELYHLGTDCEPGDEVLHPSLLLKHHESHKPIRGLAVSPDWNYVVALGELNQIFVWRRRSGVSKEIPFPYQQLPEHDQPRSEALAAGTSGPARPSPALPSAPTAVTPASASLASAAAKRGAAAASSVTPAPKKKVAKVDAPSSKTETSSHSESKQPASSKRTAKRVSTESTRKDSDEEDAQAEEESASLAESEVDEPNTPSSASASGGKRARQARSRPAKRSSKKAPAVDVDVFSQVVTRPRAPRK